jgi:hypothetical protein
LTFNIDRAIAGRCRPKSGEIRVFGHRPGTKESQIPGAGVGYMPQDTALFNEFSIEETINYFATIFSLSHEVKKSRLQNLLKFLDLPDKNRLVKNLRYFGVYTCFDTKEQKGNLLFSSIAFDVTAEDRRDACPWQPLWSTSRNC